MTGIPAPAAPATPQPPAQNLDAASQAAQDRLAGAFPDAGTGAPAQPAAPAPGAASPSPVAPGAAPEDGIDLFSENALDGLNLEQLGYRDGKKLENEIRRARETFKPFNDAFGGMNEQQRQQLLAGAPTLGADLATFSSLAGNLHPDDRNWMFSVMDLMRTDPVNAAELLADGAVTLRERFGVPAPAPLPAGQQPMPDWADPAQQFAPEDQPLTRAELTQMLADRDQAAEVRGWEDRLRAEATSLGYDLDSQDPVMFARSSALIALAGRPEAGGELTKAHELMQRMDQATIDGFVAAKQADASRPGAPADAGAPPAQLRELATTDDALAAMKNRMDSVLGPDPRRRSDE